MNEVLKAIKERFSCRDFTDTPLTKEQIKLLVEAAVASPSGKNRQPWRVIVITDKALIEELDVEGMKLMAVTNRASYETIKSRGGKMFYNAPCMMLVVSDGSELATEDCGILSQNVALAAHSLGLGSVICAMARIPLGGPRADEYTKRLQIPDGYKFGIAVLVGTAKTARPPHEPDMGKVTYI